MGNETDHGKYVPMKLLWACPKGGETWGNPVRRKSKDWPQEYRCVQYGQVHK